jgi:hypothetical protein
MSMKVESKVQIDTFDQIFTQANLGSFYDYESKKLAQINFLERVIRAILSCTGLVDSTVAKCIRVSSESLLQAIRTPSDPFITDKFRELIEKLEDVTDPKLVALIEKINKQAPNLIQNCLKALREMKAELLDLQAATNTVEILPSAEYLLAKNTGANKREKELDIRKREKELDIREEGLDKREEQLDRREEGLDERDRVVAKREVDVTKREEAVVVKEIAVQVREEAVVVKETAVKVREDKVVVDEAAVKKRETDVASRERLVAIREKQANVKDRLLTERETVVQAKEALQKEDEEDLELQALIAAHKAKKAAAAKTQPSKVVVNSPVGPTDPSGKPIRVHS